MRKQNFNEKVGRLILKIREKGEINVGEACLLLNVGPWQVKRYAQAVVDVCEDIRFDGEKLHTIITPTQQLASQQKLESFKVD